MAETDATPLGKFLAVIGHIGAIAAVVSIVAGAIAYALAAPGWFLGFCAGVCLLGVTMVFAWRVSLGSETPIETIGEWRREYVPPAKPDLLVRPFDIPHETKVEKPSGGLSLEDIEREYELKKLEPNFIDRGSEYIEAHNDEQGVIIRGTNPDGETFHALVRMFGNEHPRNNVKSLKRVSFRLKFICFDRATRNKSLSINTDRGAWLNEAQTEIEFAAHCPSKRAVVVTVEGAENQPYVVRRDSDSYKGIHPLREKLTGSIYTVFLTLLDESRNAKSYQYILEIIQEPNFELRLNDAATWKSTHLGKFAREGIVFLEKLNDISKNAEEQIPFDTTPPPSLASMLTLGTEQPAPKMDYFDTVKRRDTIEREQEEKLIEPMKDWESRAADFVDLYIGADQSRQLKDCVPSFEAGLDRQKKFRRWRFTPPDGKPLPPESPNWKLFDAVMSRIDKLGEIGKGLR